VDAEELGGAMTEKLAELFDEAAAADDQRVPVRKPDRWSRTSATFLDPSHQRRA
jgi:hypothetical protein